MPLAFAAGLGGSITLVGTPANMIINTTLQGAGLQGLGFFELAWIGVPQTIVGIIYFVTIGKYFLPKKQIEEQEIEQEIEATSHDSKHQIIAGIILFVVVVLMALNLKWRWRDSNPRPAKAPEGFLHAYFPIAFFEYL